MALTLIKAYAGQDYPWGHQIRVDFRAEDGTLVHEVLVYATEPDEEDVIVAGVEALRLRVDARLSAEMAAAAPPPPAYRVICEDGTEVLL